MTDDRCPLCRLDEASALWANEQCLVIPAEVAGLGTICRVIWRGHVREMGDLSTGERRALMDIVFAVETAVRDCARPAKMNLASLGNLVPHLHWHIIPRYQNDAYFPDAIWAAARRPGAHYPLSDERLRAALRAALGPPGKPRL
ncbi:HIT family protein [Acidiferrobacter sp.]|uniref:HIT family protein n=1 Tax=Acidiferrobacter sp. TaxID=1872107 RepID=UPI002613B57D|nr:HIT domain-containing protein [Acidiferrobacter sp.]